MRISDWSSDVCSSDLVVRRGLFDLRLDLLDAAFDATGFAGAVDDRGVLLGDLDLLGAAEVLDRGLLQRQADFLGDHGATGEDRHVFEHRLATVAEARGLRSEEHPSDLQSLMRISYAVFCLQKK